MALRELSILVPLPCQWWHAIWSGLHRESYTQLPRRVIQMALCGASFAFIICFYLLRIYLPILQKCSLLFCAGISVSGGLTEVGWRCGTLPLFLFSFFLRDALCTYGLTNALFVCFSFVCFFMLRGECCRLTDRDSKTPRSRSPNVIGRLCWCHLMGNEYFEYKSNALATPKPHG